MSPAAKKPATRKATPKAKPKPKPLTVAVTGPTGEIGRAAVRALESSKEVGRIIGMARRPFDPAAHGWRKTEYRQGDVLDRASVEHLVDGADVVVHLAFIIIAGSADSQSINLEGSRNVFEATVAAKAKRLVYTSSVAAYGFPEIDGAITEDVPVAGNDRHPYSHHKAEVEELLDAVLDGSDVDAYVLRPCIVAGPDAPLLIDQLPYVKLGERLPTALRALFDQVPVLRPVLPDPGVPFQLVHHDDVAAAIRAAVTGRGAPGAYNLAGPGELTVSDLARELGWYAVPIPELAVDATAEIVARLPFLPDEASWVESVRRPTLMDAAKARRELGWRPKFDAHQTLALTVQGARADLEAGIEE